MNLDALERTLRERLQTLAKRVSKIESDLRQAGPKDSQERATELENDEVLERLDETERQEITEIRAALARIEAGSYGTCGSCGTEIDPRRLEALPAARLCTSCAS